MVFQKFKFSEYSVIISVQNYYMKRTTSMITLSGILCMLCVHSFFVDWVFIDLHFIILMKILPCKYCYPFTGSRKLNESQVLEMM